MSSREEIERAVETSMSYMRIPGKYENYVFFCKRNGQIPLTMQELRKAAYKNYGITLREPPKTCPVCNNEVKQYETGRVLCESRLCDFEWYSKPFVKLPNKLPLDLIERLKQPGLSVKSILNAKDVQGLLSAVADLAV